MEAGASRKRAERPAEHASPEAPLMAVREPAHVDVDSPGATAAEEAVADCDARNAGHDLVAARNGDGKNSSASAARWREYIRRVRLSLTFRLNTKSEAYKRRAGEMERLLRRQVPKYLQWALRERLFGDLFHREERHRRIYAPNIEGAVLFLDLTDFTSMAAQLTQTSTHDRGQAILEKDTIDSSPDITNSVLSQHWELVISIVNRLQGDVIKFLGDGLQILFPIDPVFSHVPRSQASGKCMRRAVLFAIELMRALRSAELDAEQVHGKQMRVKMGLAYGTGKLVVLGGICQRYELNLAGPFVDRAFHLAAEVGRDETALIMDAPVAASVDLFPDPESRSAKLRLYKDVLSGSSKLSPFVHTKTEDTRVVELAAELLAEADEDVDEFASPYAANAEKVDGGHYTALRRTARRNSAAREAILATGYLASDDAEEEEEQKEGEGEEGEGEGEEEENNGRRASSLAAAAASGAAKHHETATAHHELEVLGGFLPIFELAQIAAGKGSGGIGTRFLSVLFFHLLEADHSSREGLEDMQFATAQAQLALYANGGDLRQVAIDDKGFVIIGVFGLAHADPELSAVRAAWRIMRELDGRNLTCAIGVSTGMCHVGPTGSASRCEFTVVGNVVNRSARLMSASTKAILAGVRFIGRSALFLDDETVLGLSGLEDGYAMGETDMQLKGLPDVTTVHFPVQNDRLEEVARVVETLFGGEQRQGGEDDNESKNRAEPVVTEQAGQAVLERGATSGSWRVEGTHASKRRTLSDNKRRSGSVSVLYGQLASLENDRAASEVLKHVAVMNAVSPWVETDVVAQIMDSSFFSDEIDYALNVLQSRCAILTAQGPGLFRVDLSDQVTSVYKSLQHSFRSQTHEHLADILAKRVALTPPPGTRDGDGKLNVAVMVAEHYALAGGELHLRAAKWLNHALVLQPESTLEEVEVMATRSRSLVESWSTLQKVKAETAVALPEHFLAHRALALGNTAQAAEGFRRTLLAYSSMRQLLGLGESQGSVLCPLDVVLLVTYSDDEQLFASRFRAVRLTVGRSSRVACTPIACLERESAPAKDTMALTCSVALLKADEVQRAYASTAPLLTKLPVYRVLLADASTSRHILDSLQQLSDLGPSQSAGLRPVALGEAQGAPAAVGRSQTCAVQ